MCLYAPPIILCSLLSEELLERNLTAHGDARIRPVWRRRRRRSSVKPNLPLRLEALPGQLEALTSMDSTLLDHLGVDGPRLRGRVGRRLRIDPKTVDAGIISIIVPAVVPAATTATILRRIIRFQNDVLVRELDVFAVRQSDVEVVQSPPVQHEDAVPLLAQPALRQLADKHAPLDTALLPLPRGRAEEVDDGIRGQGQYRAYGGVVPAEHGDIQLLVGAGRWWGHGRVMLLRI